MTHYLLMFLPVLLIPFVMRFAVVRVIIFLARKRLLPRRLREMEQGWEETEKESFTAAEKTVRSRLTTLFPPAYTIVADIREILLSIQHSRSGETDPQQELRFNFSIRDAAEVALLAFSDLYDDIQRSPILRRLYSMRIRWLVRAGNLTQGYARITSLPVIRQMVKSRLLAMVLRLALVPLIGLPMLLVYLIRSFATGLIADGGFRYLYALVLLRITYYGIYLYGGNNPVITARIRDLKKQEILEAGRRLEEILDARSWENRSELFDGGVLAVNTVLQALGIEKDHRLRSTVSGESTRSGMRDRGMRFLRMLKGSALMAVRRQFKSSPEEAGIVEGLHSLWEALTATYVPPERPALEQLRVGELVALGYFASLLLLSKLYSAPGIRSTLGKISVEFAVRVNALSEDELVRNLFTGAREGMRLAGMAGRLRRTGKFFRGRYHPAGLALSFATPFALAHLENSLKTGLYHRAARLMLYIWEHNSLRENPELEECLIESFR